MDPSFLALFKQGHYSRIETSDQTEIPDDRGCNQNERFSAAMIAFGFRYDVTFKKHFLQRIIEGNFQESDLSAYKIEIEPHKCSDLVIKNGTKQLIVVELKIGAELSAHQSPAQENFWIEKEGYGDQLTSKYSDFLQILFVTLEKRASWSEPVRKHPKIECSAKIWDQLIRNPIGNESSMETAIYDCLGSLGVSCFNFRGMIMKVKDQATDATQVYNLLKKTMESIGKWDSRDLAVSNPIENNSYFGVNLALKSFCEIEHLVHPRPGASVMGWLGYDSHSPNPIEPSVYLYCGDLKAAEKLQKRFENTNYKTKIFDSETYDLRISPKEEQTDELDWFVRTLKVIKALR